MSQHPHASSQASPHARGTLWPRTIRPWLRSIFARSPRVPSAHRTLAQHIASAGLPPSIADLLTTTIRSTKLHRHEQQEIAAELITHFQDGLAANRTEVDLIRTFGEPKKVASMLRSAAMNKRTPLQKFKRRLGQGVLIALAVVVSTYLIALLVFISGRPTISVPYAWNYNKQVEAIPAEQRAYPIYFEVSRTIDRAPDSLTSFATFPSPEQQAEYDAKLKADPQFDSFPQRRTDPRFAQAAAWLNQHDAAMSRLHQASKLPKAGVPFFKENPDFSPPSPGVESKKPFDPGQFVPIDSDRNDLVGVLLPFAGQYRSLARFTLLDARIAIADSNRARLMRALETQIGLVRHSREDETLISQLVALAILELHANALEEAIASGLLDVQQLQSLIQQHAVITSVVLNPSLIREREMFLDFLQRAYTDDGAGGGRMTQDGLKLLRQYALITSSKAETPSVGIAAVGPLTFLTMASRSELRTKYDAMLHGLEAASKLPPSQRGKLQTWTNPFPEEQSAIGKIRYAPLTVLFPAIQTYFQSFDRTKLRHESIILLLHLERHRLATGSYPTSLSDLPNITIPIDYFTDQPIRYRLIERDGAPRPTLYALGPDRIDDAGTRPHRPGDDATMLRFQPAEAVALENPQVRLQNRGDALLADPFQVAPRLTEDQAKAELTPPGAK